jgi:Uma2 family endonuclease
MLRKRYEKAAEAYLLSLPLEHFMESTPHATQREITLESLALVKARRPDMHVFNELLVQYPLPRKTKLGQVVPDNMVVIHDGPVNAIGSYDLPLQPARPFWVLEYVSKATRRKDYQDNKRRYADELKVPYYLLFDPETQIVTLFRHARGKYTPMKPNEHGRLTVAELDIEVALLDGWVRFWYKDELLPLPGQMLSELDAAKREVADLKAEIARLRSRGKNGKH